MPRIRTIKPNFFRHEALQDLELAHPQQYTMMVFAALWGHCDKLGRFRWQPRTLKLDILPFLPFDIGITLELLATHGFIRRYEVDGVSYGEIPSFLQHQRITGKEADEQEKFPPPPTGYTTENTCEAVETQRENNGETVETQRGNNGETVETQQGNNRETVETTGREGKGRGRGRGKEKEGNRECHGETPVTLAWVMQAWNARRGVRPIQDVTGMIRQRIQSRIRDHPSVSWWETLFTRGEASDFLVGRKTDFIVTLDWILGPKNFSKLMAGNYDNNAPTTRPHTPRSLVDLL